MTYVKNKLLKPARNERIRVNLNELLLNSLMNLHGSHKIPL
jgi:type III secretion system FlhB-like substrate exporter